MFLRLSYMHSFSPSYLMCSKRYTTLRMVVHLLAFLFLRWWCESSIKLKTHPTHNIAFFLRADRFGCCRKCQIWHFCKINFHHHECTVPLPYIPQWDYVGLYALEISVFCQIFAVTQLIRCVDDNTRQGHLMCYEIEKGRHHERWIHDEII